LDRLTNGHSGSLIEYSSAKRYSRRRGGCLQQLWYVQTLPLTSSPSTHTASYDEVLLGCKLLQYISESAKIMQITPCCLPSDRATLHLHLQETVIYGRICANLLFLDLTFLQPPCTLLSADTSLHTLAIDTCSSKMDDQ
jgi:hypothetical protein